MEISQDSYYKLLKEVKNVKTIEDLKMFLKNFFEGKNVKIYLFGSRAREDHSLYSDIDLAFESEENISKELSLLRELLEESYLPYKVDIVNLKEAPYLQELIKKEGKRWL